MRTWWRRAAISSVILLSACGGPPPPVEPTQPTASVAAEPAPPTTPDLSPAPEPPGLLLVARWKGPAKSIDQMLKLFGAPVSIESLINKEGGDAAKLLDLDGSVDAAVLLDPGSADAEPKFSGAVSIPLKSFEEARASAEKDAGVTAIRPGVVRLVSKKSEKEVCDLIVAAGDAAARLVCGGSAREVEALRDWLSRGLPRTPPESSGLNATLRAGSLKDRYLGKLRTQAAKATDEARAAMTAQNVGDPDLLAAPGVVLEEGLRFLEDLDRVDVKVALGTTPPELTSGGSVRFHSKSSWFTRVLTDANDRPGPAPEIFWRVPKDAYSATWGRGADPRLFDGVRAVAHKAVAEALGRVPMIPAADKAALEAFVDGAPKTTGLWVSATGLVPSRKKAGAKPDVIAEARDIVTSTLGWHVSGVEAPAAEYVAWARQGLDVYTRALRLVKEFSAVKKAVSSKPGKKEPDLMELVPRVKEVKSPPGYPKGTVAFDIVLHFDGDVADLLLPKKAKKALEGALKTKSTAGAKGSMTLRLAITPDGDRTWIGFSADLDELKKRMNAVMSGAPREGTLATREGLEPLRQPGQTWGGFFGFGEILEKAVEAVAKEKPEHAADARAILATLPNKGKTPLLLVGSGAAGQAPSSGVEVRLQAGSLADISAVVAFLASPKGREILKKID